MKAIVSSYISVILPSILLLSSNLCPSSPKSAISNPGITIAATNHWGKNFCGYFPNTIIPATVGKILSSTSVKIP